MKITKKYKNENHKKNIKMKITKKYKNENHKKILLYFLSHFWVVI